MLLIFPKFAERAVNLAPIDTLMNVHRSKLTYITLIYFVFFAGKFSFGKTPDHTTLQEKRNFALRPTVNHNLKTPSPNPIREVNVIVKKDGMTLIEAAEYENEEMRTQFPEKGKNSKFWITEETNKGLQHALAKGESWAELNEKHKKEFSKEIIRFRILEKRNYEYYGLEGCPKNEASLIFEGESDGSFTLYIRILEKAENLNADIRIVTAADIKRFKRLLQGKPAGAEIDKIFH